MKLSFLKICILFGAVNSQMYAQDESFKDFKYRYQSCIKELRQNALEVEDEEAYQILAEKYGNIPEFLHIIRYYPNWFQKKTSIDSFWRVVERNVPESKLSSKVDSVDLVTILQNKEISLLISDRVLKLNQTLSVPDYNPMISELYLYDIKENDVILEIGGGSGIDCIALAKLYPKSTFYVNELDSNKVKTIEERIKFHFNQPELLNIFPIQGSDNSTNFTNTADKVILCHSLHHFDNMTEMLIDIKTVMSKNTLLIINESMFSPCKEHLSKKEIKKLMRKHKFRYQYMIKINTKMILTYKNKMRSSRAIKS